MSWKSRIFENKYYTFEFSRSKLKNAPILPKEIFDFTAKINVKYLKYFVVLLIYESLKNIRKKNSWNFNMIVFGAKIQILNFLLFFKTVRGQLELEFYPFQYRSSSLPRKWRGEKFSGNIVKYIGILKVIPPSSFPLSDILPNSFSCMYA